MTIALNRDLESGGYISQSAQYRHINAPSTDILDSTQTVYPSVDYLHTKGVNTPGFKKLVNSGSLVPYTYFWQLAIRGTQSSVFRIESTNWPSSGQLYYTTPSTTGAAQSNLSFDPVVLESQIAAQSIDFDSLVQAAASSLYSGGWDALTFLAELKQTISMFRNIGYSLLDLIRRWNGKGSINAYLEGRYGWRTLIFDLQDLNKALSSLDDSRDVSSKRASQLHNWNVHTDVAADTSQFTRRVLTNEQYVLSARGSVAAEIQVPKFQFNPVTTAWELLRFSFVIDWFFSVGAALNALSLVTLSRSYTASYGWNLSVTRSVSFSGVVAKPGWKNPTITLNSTSTGTYKVRIPTGVSVLPHFRLNLDGWKVTDLLALVLQALRR